MKKLSDLRRPFYQIHVIAYKERSYDVLSPSLAINSSEVLTRTSQGYIAKLDGHNSRLLLSQNRYSTSYLATAITASGV